MADDRAEPIRGAPPWVAEVELVVPASVVEAGLRDARVEPFDRRAFLRVRTDVQHLGDVSLLEPFNPERRGDVRLDLGPSNRELLLDLVVGRLVR
jgi:hypothetical protein